MFEEKIRISFPLVHIGRLNGSDNGRAESEGETHHMRFIASLHHHFVDRTAGMMSSTGSHNRETGRCDIGTLHPLWVSFLSALSLCVFNGYDVRAVYLRMQEVGLISNSLRVTDSLLGDSETESPRAGKEGTWVGAADSIVSEVSRCSIGSRVNLPCNDFLFGEGTYVSDGRQYDVIERAVSVPCLL
jgi:hypothetical protein